MFSLKKFENQGSLNLRFLTSVGLAIVFTLSVAYFFYGLQPIILDESAINNKDFEFVEFKIEKGEGFREIGARLSRGSLIRSITVFKLYSLISGNAGRFQNGVHEISYSMSIPQIIESLAISGKNEVRIVIPEGFTLKDIENVLLKKGVLDEQNLISDFPIGSLEKNYPYLRNVLSFEGLLFPDTYYFRYNSSPEEVIKTFLNNFNKKAWDLLEFRDDWYDVLILASFLEKEIPDFEERRIVAGILLKRLKVGMPLQIDFTISYAKCDGLIQGCNEVFVRREDVNFRSPFNTYLRLGWTPTPIANPGRLAIKAALSPVETQYWYYLSARGTKETMFSATLEEHNKKRAIYLLGNF